MELKHIPAALSRIGGRLSRTKGALSMGLSSDAEPDALEAWERRIVEEAGAHTMTGVQRLVATIDAVTHVIRKGIPGALVECGVWKGGSVLAMIRTLQKHGIDDRDVYLFDTFEGMTQPTERDTSRFGTSAPDALTDSLFAPAVFNIDAVRSLILGSGYPERRVRFVRGRVEDTLPAAAPSEVAVLRLDTDWYDSTWHELVHLYPRLSEGGVLMIDDYGHWDGCRAAVDRYFSEVAAPILLSRIDYTGRVGVKDTQAVAP